VFVLVVSIAVISKLLSHTKGEFSNDVVTEVFVSSFDPATLVLGYSHVVLVANDSHPKLGDDWSRSRL